MPSSVAETASSKRIWLARYSEVIRSASSRARFCCPDRLASRNASRPLPATPPSATRDETAISSAGGSAARDRRHTRPPKLAVRTSAKDAVASPIVL